MPDRPLETAFALAEAACRDQLFDLGRACEQLLATAYERSVLRWCLDHGAGNGPIPLDPAAVAAAPWVACSPKTVRRAVATCLHWGLLVRSLDSHYAINWPLVRQLLAQRVLDCESKAGTHSPRRGLPVQSLDPQSTVWTHSPEPETAPPPPDARPLGATLPTHALARARAICLLSSVLLTTDVDVDSFLSDSERAREPTTDANAVACLAIRAYQTIYRRPWSPRNLYGEPQEMPESICAAAILAAGVLGEQWLATACRATKAKGDAAKNAERFFLGCLAQGLVETAGLDLPDEPRILRSWLGRLMQAVSAQVPAVRARLIPSPQSLIPNP